MKLKVYVSGPYSKHMVEGTRNAILAAEELRKAGYLPFVPHLSLLWDLVCPSPYEEWIEYDLEWLQHCDLMLRLPGESPGADREVKYAQELDIPICYSIEEVLQYA
jgi:hypothetical protein